MKHDTENGGSQTIKISHPLQIWKGPKIWSQASNAYNCRWLFEMSQGVNDKQFRSCYSISNHKTGWYHTHEVLPAVPLLPQRAVAGIIQGAKGELGSQWVKNVQVIQSLIIYQSRFNIHRSNYPRRWAEVRTGQQLILRVTHFSVSVENRDITTAAHFVPINFFSICPYIWNLCSFATILPTEGDHSSFVWLVLPIYLSERHPGWFFIFMAHALYHFYYK